MEDAEALCRDLQSKAGSDFYFTVEEDEDSEGDYIIWQQFKTSNNT